MQLSDSAQSAYTRYWGLASDVALAAEMQPGEGYTSSLAVEAASQAAQLTGVPLTFQQATGVSSLYGIARNIESRATALTNAEDDDSIGPQHVSEAPWSRSMAEQNALPMWHARAQFTYLDESGLQIEGWTTVVVTQVLPPTVGRFRTQLTARIEDQLASPPGTGTPRSGQLLDIGRTYLMAV